MKNIKLELKSLIQTLDISVRMKSVWLHVESKCKIADLTIVFIFL